MVESFTVLGVGLIVAGGCLGAFWLSFKMFLAMYFPAQVVTAQQRPDEMIAASLNETFYGESEPESPVGRNTLNIYARQYLTPDAVEDEGIKEIRQKLKEEYSR